MPIDRMAILGSPVVLPREEVPTPEWGPVKSVWVRTLTATERDHVEAAWESTKRVHFRARLAVACVCDEEGKDVFEMGDIPALGLHSTTVIGRICEVAFRLNRFTKEDVEELEKN